MSIAFLYMDRRDGKPNLILFDVDICYRLVFKFSYFLFVQCIQFRCDMTSCLEATDPRAHEQTV